MNKQCCLVPPQWWPSCLAIFNPTLLGNTPLGNLGSKRAVVKERKWAGLSRVTFDQIRQGIRQLADKNCPAKT